MNINSVTPYSYITNVNFRGYKISPTQCKFVGKENIAWPKIQIGTDSNRLLQVTLEDFNALVDPMKAFARIGGEDGIFQFSLVNSDKKAIITVPNKELTANMKVIETAMQAGTHPFMKDILEFLNSHPEVVAEIEKI